MTTVKIEEEKQLLEKYGADQMKGIKIYTQQNLTCDRIQLNCLGDVIDIPFSFVQDVPLFEVFKNMQAMIVEAEKDKFDVPFQKQRVQKFIEWNIHQQYPNYFDELDGALFLFFGLNIPSNSIFLSGSLYHGPIDPPKEIGTEGSVYLHLGTNNVYVKQNDNWVLKTNFTGPIGPQGLPGPAGRGIQYTSSGKLVSPSTGRTFY